LKLTSVGQVIATRAIRMQGSSDTAFIVKIGLPCQFPDSTDYYCPIQITTKSGESNAVRYAAGIDAVQALQLAMKAVGAILYSLNEEAGGKLRWDGDEEGDLGFPFPT
jgi:uncharacterized protein DUF6968